MKRKEFIPENECKDIWIKPGQLKEMYLRGDVMGLHSHTHFTSLNSISKEMKEWEYSTNKANIEKIVQRSYPCDTFDAETDSILTSLGVDIAFITHYEEKEMIDLHRIPRLDASVILKRFAR